MSDDIDNIAPVIALVKRPDKDVIECDADALPWTSYLNEQARCRKVLLEQIDPLVEAAHEKHKSLVARRKELVAAFVAGEDEAKRVLMAWQLAEQERRRAEQRRLDEEARLAAIAAAKRAGDKQEAKAIASGRIAVVSDTVVAPVKVDGFSVRMVKSAVVVNMVEFVRACLARRSGMSVELLAVEQGALNKLVRALPDGTTFPGVNVKQEPESRRTSRV